jgi:hypothetical protein
VSELAALRLLGRWSRLRRGHVAFPAGCSCGVANSGVQIEALEQSILDHLRRRFGSGYDVLPTEGLEELLRTLAAGRTGLPARERTRMLREIGVVIDSFEEVHRGP